MQNAATILLAVLGPVLAVATYVIMGPLSDRTASTGLRLIFLADLIYILLLVGLVAARLAGLVTARKSSATGSRLHMRLVGVFTALALVPTVLVALFAGLTVNIGLEGWFSDRVQQVVGTSLAAAEAYQDEHRRDLREDAMLLARVLNDAGQGAPVLDDGTIRTVLTEGQALIQRGLREAYVIDGTGAIRARGDRSYRFWYEQPTEAQFQSANREGITLIEDWQNSEFRALVHLDRLANRYLYVTRDVDGSLLGLLDDTRATVGEYQELERTRSRVLFEFSLLYLGFALLLVAAAIWLGLSFAERLARPIGRLGCIRAEVQRVRAGCAGFPPREAHPLELARQAGAPSPANTFFSSFFKILPLALRGRVSGQNTTFTGTLKAAIRSAAKARSSSSVALAPGVRWTMAPGSSPSVLCGTATTAASITAGCS